MREAGHGGLGSASDAERELRGLTAPTLALFVVAYVVAIGLRRLTLPDEVRYAEVGREVLATANWGSPRLQGRQEPVRIITIAPRVRRIRDGKARRRRTATALFEGAATQPARIPEPRDGA